MTQTDWEVSIYGGSEYFSPVKLRFGIIMTLGRGSKVRETEMFFDFTSAPAGFNIPKKKIDALSKEQIRKLEKKLEQKAQKEFGNIRSIEEISIRYISKRFGSGHTAFCKVVFSSGKEAHVTMGLVRPKKEIIPVARALGRMFNVPKEKIDLGIGHSPTPGDQMKRHYGLEERLKKVIREAIYEELKIK